MKGLCIMCNKWDASCDCRSNFKPRVTPFCSAIVLHNQFIQLSSDDWRVLEHGNWRKMTLAEQLAVSGLTAKDKEDV